MYEGLLVIDADAHKLENPLVMRDYLPSEYRDRVGMIVDGLGDQRAQVKDKHPATGAEMKRVFPKPQGLGKGGFRNMHPETTLGATFNKRRLEDMDREGIDIHVIYGTFNLTFGSLFDTHLAVELCKAYNNYMAEDCQPYGDRLKPIGVLPMQDVAEAVKEMERCANDLGMIGVAIAPNVPVPHPDAPEAFPKIYTCKHLSHPDFHPIFAKAVELDLTIGTHGGPGSGMVGGIADHMETFVLNHIFVQRNQQQMALARMVFDGVFEKFPTLRMGFVEGGCGWVPDLAHSFHEHWEKRIRDFDPKNAYRPPLMEVTKLLVQERGQKSSSTNLVNQARNLFELLWNRDNDFTKIDDASLYEHYDLRHRDPMEYFRRGQIFFTFESDDPGPAYLPIALGEMGKNLACFSGDYGHWDGVLAGCVKDVADNISDREYLGMLLGGNALDLYGDRLRNSIPQHYRQPELVSS